MHEPPLVVTRVPKCPVHDCITFISVTDHSTKVIDSATGDWLRLIICHAWEMACGCSIEIRQPDEVNAEAAGA